MRIKVDLKIFLIMFFYIFTRNIDIFVLTLLFIFVHELGHVLSGLTIGLKLKKVNVNCLGFSIEFENYGRQRNMNKIIIDFAGPFVNLLAFTIAYAINKPLIAYINLCILIVNLLPIFPLDGGRILKSILLCKISYKDTMRWIEIISKDTLIVITFLSSFLILYFKNIAFFLLILYF